MLWNTLHTWRYRDQLNRLSSFEGVLSARFAPKTPKLFVERVGQAMSGCLVCSFLYVGLSYNYKIATNWSRSVGGDLGLAERPHGLLGCQNNALLPTLTHVTHKSFGAQKCAQMHLYL